MPRRASARSPGASICRVPASTRTWPPRRPCCGRSSCAWPSGSALAAESGRRGPRTGGRAPRHARSAPTSRSSPGSGEDAAVFLQDWRFLDEPHRAEIAARRDAYEAVLRGLLLAKARWTGRCEPSTGPADAAVTGRAILAALNGIAAWYHPAGALDPGAVADAYLSFFMRGLEARP